MGILFHLWLLIREPVNCGVEVGMGAEMNNGCPASSLTFGQKRKMCPIRLGSNINSIRPAAVGESEEDVTFHKPPVGRSSSLTGSHKSKAFDSLQGKCIFDSFIPGLRNGSESSYFRLRCPVLVKL